jgi:hypothetical protein
MVAEDRAGVGATPAGAGGDLSNAGGDSPGAGVVGAGSIGAGGATADVARRSRVARVREGERVGRAGDEAPFTLEETPDDAGLRFVLAAVVLFILSVVLLFLSTTVLR